MQLRLFSLLSFMIIFIHLENVSSFKPSLESKETKHSLDIIKKESESRTILIDEPENIVATEEHVAPDGSDVKQIDSPNKPNLESTKDEQSLEKVKNKPKSSNTLVAEPENKDATEQRAAPEGNDIKQLNLTCCGTWVYGPSRFPRKAYAYCKLDKNQKTATFTYYVMLPMVAIPDIRPNKTPWVNRLAARKDSVSNALLARRENLITEGEFEQIVGCKVLLMPPDNFPAYKINDDGETFQTKVVDEDANYVYSKIARTRCQWCQIGEEIRQKVKFTGRNMEIISFRGIQRLPTDMGEDIVYTLFITMAHDFNSIYEEKGGAYIIVDDDISEMKRRDVVAAFLSKNGIKPERICHDQEHYICENHTKISADITRIPLDSNELLRLLNCAYEIDLLPQQQQQQQQQISDGTGDNENRSSACSSIDALFS